MDNRHWLCLFLGGVGWLAIERPAPAQGIVGRPVPAVERDRSHISLPPRNIPPELAQQFLDQRLYAQDLAELEKLAPQIAQNPKFKVDGQTLTKIVQERLYQERKLGWLDPADPELRSLVERLLQAQKDSGNQNQPLKPEQFAASLKVLEQFAKQYPPPSTDPSSTGQVPGLGNTPLDSMSPMTDPSANLEALGPDHQGLTAEQLESLLERVERFSPFLSRSPSLQQALRDLEQLSAKERSPESVSSAWPSLERALTLEKLTGAVNWSLPRDSFTWLRGVNWPGGKPSVRSLPSVALPRIRSAQSGYGDSWQTLAWLVAGVVLALLLWKTLARHLGRGAQAGDCKDHSGPWPVQPAMVATREQLIRAFEYLSVLRLGKDARNWNHLHIGDRLGEQGEASTDRRHAARRLTSLYEKARYTPHDEAQPELDWDAARRDLCFLAGVAHA